jgi:hypothetical protein
VSEGVEAEDAVRAALDEFDLVDDQLGLPAADAFRESVDGRYRD